MKKLLTVILIFLICFSLSSCNISIPEGEWDSGMLDKLIEDTFDDDLDDIYDEFSKLAQDGRDFLNDVTDSTDSSKPESESE